MSKPAVMIIDDEKVVGDMSKYHLEAAGFEVETFVDPAKALDRFREKSFEVVVTDLKMKGIDGMEVLKTIKSLAPKSQVIMITAFAHLNTAIEALRGEVFDFFPKPFKIKEFVESVRRAAERAQA
ncbi:response regulator [Oceanidesulfovibrio marinus]|uniref:Response regulator n=1 Tax=Oceanidesulfovibrio marinus TaxID=370038 RepID=A0ABX6NDJ0_9BACT|nr:response regulator [Oceanidesulfovibrio marinus]QJT08632.1 response regulator [Oceanidesulfovibrio marinus]